MPPARFQSAIPASEQPQTHIPDNTATELGTVKIYAIKTAYIGEGSELVISE
jgi:hypothetical protein